MQLASKISISLSAVPAMIIIAGLLVTYTEIKPQIDDHRPVIEPIEETVVSTRAGKPVITLATDVNTFYDSVDLVASNQVPAGELVRGGIVPHHDLAAELIAEFWQRISLSQEPETIVIVGPNHQELGPYKATSSQAKWRTINGELKADESLINELVDRGLVGLDDEILSQEHAVGTLIPYISYYFPETEIVPIALSSRMTIKESQKLAGTLNDLADENTIIVASIDFSHYLTSDQAESVDQATYQAILDYDYQAISGFNSDYLDSPPAVNVFLSAMEGQGAIDFKILQHTNSGILVNQEVYSSTSYYTMLYSQPDDRISIVLGGDTMLGRGVESKMRTYGQEYPFTEIQYLFVNQDVVFINLESVISDIYIESEKEIRFKGNPEVIPYLKDAGVTYCSVVNNHVYDFSRAAWDQSVDLLGGNGIQAVGHVSNQAEPVYQDIDGTTVAYLAFDETVLPFDLTSAESLITEADSKADVVIASIHWGQEYFHEHNGEQEEIGHAFIDSGADVIMGHHPHVLQDIELYNEGIIFYSLGNLVFDQFHREDVNQSMVVELNISEGEVRSAELRPIRLVDYKPRIAEPRYWEEILASSGIIYNYWILN